MRVRATRRGENGAAEAYDHGMSNTHVGLAVLAAALASAPDRAVPVEEEPYHKTVFKNDYVQAFRVTLEPGKTTLMHTHAHADAAVRLSTATVAADSPGEPIGPPEPVTPGFVSARENEPVPTTHRVHNIGKTVFDVIDVQVLKRPPGPAAEAISPPAAENSRMRLYRYELEPNAASARHSHTRPYLLVAVTDVALRMTSPDGASMEHPVKAGDMHWVDTAVTHTLANRGTEKAILVEFELE
jgi:quercetin dioxygenase-like cupin family protein